MLIVYSLGSLNSSLWSVEISKNSDDLMDSVPHKSENTNAGGKIFSIRLSFDETGNRIFLKLLSWRVFLCHIYVHAVSSECGYSFIFIHLKRTTCLGLEINENFISC